jgi:hypothetical protein
MFKKHEILNTNNYICICLASLLLLLVIALICDNRTTATTTTTTTNNNNNSIIIIPMNTSLFCTLFSYVFYIRALFVTHIWAIKFSIK